MPVVEVRNLSKSFDGKAAIRSASFTIQDGEILALLGPSGCGKTTALRCLAGLEVPDGGQIIADGKMWYWGDRGVSVPTVQRGVGMVFQSYALWPHRTVSQNVGYGLKMLGVHRSAIAERVQTTLATMGLGGLGDRYPSSLSGGQQQRVAVARSLIVEPKFLLLDEPLSNLDLKLRETMRFELRQLIKSRALTALFVTHDQDEAMVVADNIVVMAEGDVVQFGTARELYDSPRSRHVAEFLGGTNLFDVEVRGLEEGSLQTLYNGETVLTASSPSVREYTELEKVDLCLLSVRPEVIKIVREEQSSVEQGKENILRGIVEQVTFLGSRTVYYVRLPSSQMVLVENLVEIATPGDSVRLEIPPEVLTVIPDSK